MARRTSITALFVIAMAGLSAGAVQAQNQPEATASGRTVTIVGGPYKPGEMATVTWAGFTKDKPAYLYICGADSDPATPPLVEQCYGETLVEAVSDANGSGSAKIEVRSIITPQVVTLGNLTDTVGAASTALCHQAPCEIAVTECSAAMPASAVATAPLPLAPMPDGMDPSASDDPNVTAKFVEEEFEWYYTRRPLPPRPEPPPLPSLGVATGPRVMAVGSDLSGAVYNHWGRGVAGALNTNFDFTLSTSATAIDSVIAGNHDLALTTAPVLSDQQRATLAKQGRTLVAVPISLSTTGIGFNAYPGLPLRELRVSARSAAGFLHNDGQPLGANPTSIQSPEFQASLGPCASPTSRLIKPYFKGGGSDVTVQMSSWLDVAASDVEWPFGVISDMPVPNLGQILLNHAAVAPAVIDPKFSDNTKLGVNARLGLVDSAWAKREGLPMAMLQNASGNWVAPSAAGALATLKTSPIGDDHIVDIDYTSLDVAAYPLTSVNYALVPANFDDEFTAEHAEAVRNMLTYFVSNDGQRLAADQGFIPLPFSLQSEALDAIGEIGATAPTPPITTTTTTTTTTVAASTTTTTAAASTTTTGAATTSSTSTSTTTASSTTTRPTSTATTRPATSATTTPSATTPAGSTSSSTGAPAAPDDSSDASGSPVVVEEDPPPPDVFSDMFGSMPFSPNLPTLGATGAATVVAGQGIGLWRREKRRPKLTSLLRR